jgi:hypothetical protein
MSTGRVSTAGFVALSMPSGSTAAVVLSTLVTPAWAILIPNQGIAADGTISSVGDATIEAEEVTAARMGNHG